MKMKIMMITQQQQQQQQQQKRQEEEKEEELNYFESIYHLAEVSVYKLNPPSRPRTEPTLRRQLLVRNLLEMSARLITTQPKQQEEELWLDACFSQLDANDQAMDDQQEQEEEEQVQEKIVLMIPFCKKQNTLFQL